MNPILRSDSVTNLSTTNQPVETDKTPISFQLAQNIIESNELNGKELSPELNEKIKEAYLKDLPLLDKIAKKLEKEGSKALSDDEYKQLTQQMQQMGSKDVLTTAERKFMQEVGKVVINEVLLKEDLKESHPAYQLLKACKQTTLNIYFDGEIRSSRLEKILDNCETLQKVDLSSTKVKERHVLQILDKAAHIQKLNLEDCPSLKARSLIRIAHKLNRIEEKKNENNTIIKLLNPQSEEKQRLLQAAGLGKLINKVIPSIQEIKFTPVSNVKHQKILVKAFPKT
ncbi:hypothetical protein BN1013_02085 [Candidatus Rubidus massiliensis]|nr:hypothetical protein BN1013_02085 [Candidatus Rubidus massiliensis]